MVRGLKGAATSLISVGATSRSADLPRERRVPTRSERSERREAIPVSSSRAYGTSFIGGNPEQGMVNPSRGGLQ
jgi:hypothetical protein